RAFPAEAKKWEIQDNGKTYVFHLKDDVYFSDGKKLDSSLINYNFSDVRFQKPDIKTVIFTLKDSYSPFLSTVSNRKIFKDNFVGIGDYKIDSIKVNGDFVESVEIESVKNSKERITYRFFDT